MNLENRNGQRGSTLPYFIIIVGAFLAMAAVLWFTRDEARAPLVGSDRAVLRHQNLAENCAEGEAALTSYAVVNAEKGIYQIPVDRAIETVIREWKQPQKAVEVLAERVDLATFVPPPPPEAPSEFE